MTTEARSGKLAPAGKMPRARIALRNVTLRYPISPLDKRSIKEDLIGIVRKPDKRISVDFVTALDDITLDIAQGERVGLIGRNGSGKSSFLRLVAGVYLPDKGTVEVEGQIQGMFDIGVGFEAHASGRDNIMYRGLVMGLTPDEIRARTDEIIAFAAIGDFIDLPLRTYSAGMGVRLAFAISTFLEGDVLLIDEIFGAGDLDFFAKAKARMQRIVNDARIVCFASHDLATVRDICSRAIWIHQGVVRMDGPAADVTSDYEKAVVRGDI